MPGFGRARIFSRSPLLLLAGGALLALATLVVFSIHSSGDYNVAAPVGGDNTAPGIVALLHGSVDGYTDHQPVVGLTSILLRLPFVAVANALGASALQSYQVGALICLLPLILGGAWLIASPGLSSGQRLIRLLAVVAVIQSPIMSNGISAGHPEGILSTALGTAAVLAAMRGRATWAGLLLGLAISSKETGLLALAPVMVALPGRRREVAAITAGVLILMSASVWMADPGAFLSSLHGEGMTRYLTPFSLLWPLASPLHIGAQLSVARVMPVGLTRTRASALVLLAAGCVFVYWYWRAHQRGVACRPLILLVLMGLLRCVCDSTHEIYYWITALIPLAAWEMFEHRLPVKALLLSASVIVPLLLARTDRPGPPVCRIHRGRAAAGRLRRRPDDGPAGAKRFSGPPGRPGRPLGAGRRGWTTARSLVAGFKCTAP